MENPLHANCQEFKVDSEGKVVGVKLGIMPVPGAIYEVYNVRLQDEYEANGRTTANCKVLDKNKVVTGIQVRMAWPGQGPRFDDSALPGNPSNQHMITNGYSPPELGFLALHVGGHNAPISDIVYGLGLPFNRHVSFEVTFIEKGAIITPPPTDDVAERVAKLEQWARDVSAHFAGAPRYE